ncbi:hemolysin family protein [Maribellus sp. YY47]|uniref:CNNM domain-containing protein n=1 Tax=Maribellus sp. YY47 TaxID=2929486 RepID=UPI0020007BEC|nr:hemolysin family protein [Maribellus sp. YY47]MCK3684769.1 hemolysin family protein [Maribellus sp. YY47]
MGTLIFFFVVSILVSFLCSICEAVLLSVTPSYISRMQNEKPVLGNILAHFKDDIDRPLSAILTLNTIAHTVGAIGVGIEAGKIFGAHKMDLYLFDLTYESLIAGVMTLAILVLSEIIPKTIGATYWKQLTGFTVQTLRILVFILAPFIWLSNLLTRSLKRKGTKSVFSRADVAAMADAGLKSGAIDQEEKSIILNLLQLENLKIKQIMTPRTVVLSLDEDRNLGDIYVEHNPFQFSRIPVYHETPDNITGMVLKDVILENLAEDKHAMRLADIRRDVIFVQDNWSVARLLDTLILERQHLVMVADEFGTIVGLVTMEDVIETLFGLEIVDESDKVEDLQKLARSNWIKRVKRDKPQK